MDLFSYCYNIVFILFFTVALSSCFTAYGVTKKKVFQWFGMLMLAYIFESVFVAIFSVLNTQHIFSEAYFPVLALFTGVETYLIGRIIYSGFAREKDWALLVVSVSSTACAIAGMLIAGNVGWFLDATTFSFAVLILCGIYWWLLHQAKETPCCQLAVKYNGLMVAMGAFYGLSVLENIIYLSGAHVLIDRWFPLYRNHISFFSDAFCLILSTWLVFFAQKEQELFISRKIEELLQQRMGEFQTRQQEKQKKISSEQVQEFGTFYGLTERETEILCLILEGKSNQEISQLLYITIGTVKAHVHSIFSKLEVSRRGQLMNRFVNHGIQ